MSTVCEPKIQSGTQTLLPWKIILYNDSKNIFDFVVQKVQEITRLQQPDAIARVKEAHKNGKSILLTTHREKAELIVEQFAAHDITVSMEK